MHFVGMSATTGRQLCLPMYYTDQYFTPTNPANRPGHLSHPYGSTPTANGQNATLTLWPHFHLQQPHTFPLISQLTEAYNYGSSIQIDDLTFTLSIPHKLQLDQPNTIIEA